MTTYRISVHPLSHKAEWGGWSNTLTSVGKDNLVYIEYD